MSARPTVQASPQTSWFSRQQMARIEDVEEAAAVGSRVIAPSTLRAAGAVPFGARITGVPLGTSMLAYFEYGDEVTLESSVPVGCYVLIVVVKGRISVVSSHGRIDIGPGECTVVSPPADVTLTFAAGTQELCARVPLPSLMHHFAGHFGIGLDSPPVFSLDSKRRPEWISSLTLGIRTLDRLEEDGRHGPITMRLEQSLLDSLVLSHANTGSARMFDIAHRPVERSSILAVARQMRENPGQQATLLDMARAHGLSLRSMQEGFRRELGTTPSAFLLDARLELAHRLLTAPSEGAITVTEAATAAGFGHLGRFSAAFRERYGLSPREIRRWMGRSGDARSES